MASERIQRRIGLLLDEADEAVAQGDWALVRDCSQKVLVVDPENQEALTFLAIAERGLGTQDTSSLERATVPSAPTPAPAPPDAQPTSFANGGYEVKRFLGEGGKMVTGRPPFLGDDSVAIIGQHSQHSDGGPHLGQRAVPAPFRSIDTQVVGQGPLGAAPAASALTTLSDSITIEL